MKTVFIRNYSSLKQSFNGDQIATFVDGLQEKYATNSLVEGPLILINFKKPYDASSYIGTFEFIEESSDAVYVRYVSAYKVV